MARASSWRQLRSAKKPAQCASSSPWTLKRRSATCPNKHTHQQLIGGRGKEAAFYPVELVEAILRGIRGTADMEEKRSPPSPSKEFVCALRRAEKVQDVPPSLEVQVQAEGLRAEALHEKIPFKSANGRVMHTQPKYKDAYRDEYTNDILPHDHMGKAMHDEVGYMRKEVVEGVSLEEALADPEHVLLGGRWVNANKQDSSNPDCRAAMRAKSLTTAGRRTQLSMLLPRRWKQSVRCLVLGPSSRLATDLLSRYTDWMYAKLILTGGRGGPCTSCCPSNLVLASRW